MIKNNSIQKISECKKKPQNAKINAFNHIQRLTKCGQICDILINGRDNPTEQHKANNSTPDLTRAFFVHSNRTSNQNGLLCLFSMIACDGKRESVGGLPCVAVLSPRRTLSPSRDKQSDNFKNQHKELSAMIYLFLGIHRQNLADTNRTFKTLPKQRLAVRAQCEQDARARIASNWCILQSWTFQNQAEINRTFANLGNKGVIYA